MRAVTAATEIEGVPNSILLIDLPEYSSFGDLEKFVYGEHKAEAASAGVLLVRSAHRAPGHIYPDINGEDYRKFRNRFDHKPCHIIYPENFELAVGPNLHSGTSSPIKEGILDEKLAAALREVDLCHLLRFSQAIIGPTPQYLYRSPSGALANVFIRVGNIQNSREALGAVFFWIYPHLKNCGAILTDTWSISSIALQASRMMWRLHPGFDRVRVDMLPAYQEGVPPTESEINQILLRMFREQPHDVLFLLSANMTSGLAGTIAEAVNNIGAAARLKTLSIFELGKQKSHRTLCDLTAVEFGKQRIRYGDDITDDEKTHNVKIPIDHHVYFPLLEVEEPVRIDRSTAESASVVVAELDVATAISLHKDHSEKSRVIQHHAIHIDVGRLIQRSGTFSSAFCAAIDDVRAKTQGGKGPDLLISPNHEAAKKLSALCEKELGKHQVFQRGYTHDTLDQSGVDDGDASVFAEIRRLNSNSTILVVDDVVITGQRISRYQKHLRDLDYMGKIVFVVGVERPPNLAEWQGVKGRIQQGGRIDIRVIRTLELPNWSEETCPWCREVRRYEELAKKGRRMPEIIRERHRYLAVSKSRGLREEVFCRLPNDTDIKIGPKSFFIREGCSHAGIFASVAAAVQRLRNQTPPKTLSRKHYPLAPVLKWTEHLSDTYTDSALRAAILRATKKIEMRSVNPETETERRRAVERLLNSTTADELTLGWEILLDAAIANDLPIIVAQQNVGTNREGWAEVHEFLTGESFARPNISTAPIENKKRRSQNRPSRAPPSGTKRPFKANKAKRRSKRK